MTKTNELQMELWTNELEKAKALFSGLNAEIREMGNDLDYIYKSFKDSVNELSKQDRYLSDSRKSFKNTSLIQIGKFSGTGTVNKFWFTILNYCLKTNKTTMAIVTKTAPTIPYFTFAETLAPEFIA